MRTESLRPPCASGSAAASRPLRFRDLTLRELAQQLRDLPGAAVRPVHDLEHAQAGEDADAEADEVGEGRAPAAPHECLAVLDAIDRTGEQDQHGRGRQEEDCGEHDRRAPIPRHLGHGPGARSEPRPAVLALDRHGEDLLAAERAGLGGRGFRHGPDSVSLNPGPDNLASGPDVPFVVRAPRVAAAGATEVTRRAPSRPDGAGWTSERFRRIIPGRRDHSHEHRTACRRQDPRPHHGADGAVRDADPRRPRRGGDQGRAARRRRHPPDRADAQPRHGPHLPARQPRQAERRARSEAAGGARRPAPPRAARRRDDLERPPGGDEAARPRLRRRRRGATRASCTSPAAASASADPRRRSPRTTTSSRAPPGSRGSCSRPARRRRRTRR